MYLDVAYEYALKYGPSEETRKIACEAPLYAYLYAKNIDKCPREDTRKVACKSPFCAHAYAKSVDKGPREDTREAACEDSEFAYLYAEDVDKSFHEETWAVVRNTEWEEKYKKFINSRMKEEII